MQENNGTSRTAPRLWVLTDGKAGDAVQCVAVAAALGLPFEERMTAPRPPWEWVAPWGPVDPREAPGRKGGPLEGPLPDVAIISGRRAVPHGRALKKASGGAVRVVMLKDPRFGRDIPDVLWAPAHDQLEGGNVITTLTTPHSLGAALADPGAPCAAIAELPPSFLGVILGGPSGGADYSSAAARDLAARVSRAGEAYGAIAVTPSRRTPQEFIATLKRHLVHAHVFVWDRTGDNPYRDILARAGALIVPGDSHNMTSEALASSAPVYIWRPEGISPKIDWFVAQVIAEGHAQLFEDEAAYYGRRPLDATPEIVAKIRDMLEL